MKVDSNILNNQEHTSNKQIVFTTPIFYPNAAPHIGHAYTCVVTDFLARYYNNKGYKVFFSTGLDEHGQKIQKTAERKGITPQEHVDEMVEIFQNMMQKYNIKYDVFIRTTSAKHKKSVQAFWKKLEENGYIYLNKYIGWYDVSDEAFVKDNEIDEKTKSGKNAKTYDGKNVILLEEECYFFKLSAFTKMILDHYQKKPQAIYPHTRLNEVLGFLKQDLHDIAVSRTTLKWGIKVPESHKTAFQKCVEYVLNILAPKKQHVIYVWIDALVNYLTILDYPQLSGNLWPDNIKNDSIIENKVVHIIGKDILKFHAIYWLGFLFAADLSAPQEILTHGWWLIDSDKMSKSKGNMVDPVLLAEKYGCDQMRWFFLRDMAFGDDANFSIEQVVTRCNELANVIGNLVQRSISLLHQKFNGVICQPDDVLEVNKTYYLLEECVKNRKLHLYANHVLELAAAANQYFDHASPWKEDIEGKESSLKVLSNVLYVVQTLGKMLLPLLPDSAAKILSAFPVQNIIVDYQENVYIKEVGVLFPRIKI